jgi:hypothetical protein
LRTLRATAGAFLGSRGSRRSEHGNWGAPIQV